MGVIGMVFAFPFRFDPGLATTATSQSFSMSAQRCQVARLSYWSAPMMSTNWFSGCSLFKEEMLSKVKPEAPGRSSRSSMA